MIRKRKKSFQKGLAVVLSAAMVLGMLPGMGIGSVSASATTATPNDVTAMSAGGVEKISVSAIETITKPAVSFSQQGPAGKSTGSAVTFTALDGTPGAPKENYPNLIDGKSDKWCVEGFNESSAYIIFKASDAISINGYSFITANDTSEYWGRNPESWILYGCNNYGTESYDENNSWESIHSISNCYDIQYKDHTKYDFTLDTPSSEKYRYFKLHITETSGADVLQLAEFVLNYSVCKHNWTPTSYDATCTEPAYTVNECTKCKLSYKTTDTDSQPLGHSYKNGICTLCGLEVPECIDDVYQIHTAEQLYWFAGLVNGDSSICVGTVTQNKGANAVLCSDIIINENLAASLNSDGTAKDGFKVNNWTSIGKADNTRYEGTFNGQGHTIYGLYNKEDRGYGLFGFLNYSASVYNLGIADCWFNYSETGIFCLYNFGTIANCYISNIIPNTIEEDTIVSAIVEENNDGHICNCYFNYQLEKGAIVTSKNNNTSENITTGFGKSSAQFASGEVAYLLSQGCVIGEGESAQTYDGSVWGQEIGKDSLPMADSQHKVYATTGCVVYSNDSAMTGEKAHQYNENNICQDCYAENGPLPVSYLDEKGDEQTANGTTLTANTITMTGTETTGWYVAKGKTTIYGRIQVQGNVCLILEDKAELTIFGGIQVPENASFTIYSQSAESDAGQLTILNPDKYYAGIGGSHNTVCGSITISGGNIQATGSSTGAAIGGGGYAAGGNITINNGTVTAYGGYESAAIGTGSFGTGGSITINGGTIYAEGGYRAAAIGGGYSSKGVSITINGSTIYAEGNNSAAAIGNGCYGAGGSITISNGNIYATGGDYGAAIGGGSSDENTSTVTISGGNIQATGGYYGAAIGGSEDRAGGSITISGGIIQATGGDSADGIGNGSCSSSTENATVFQTQTTDTEKGNAIIFTNSITDCDDTTDWNGLIFINNAGKLYGDSVTLEDNLVLDGEKVLTIEEDNTLIIGENKVLNLASGENLVKNGHLTVNGMIINHSGTAPEKDEGLGAIHTDADYNGICDDSTCIKNNFQKVTITDNTEKNIQGLGTISLSATVSSIENTSGPITCQWYEKDSEGAYSAIEGATSPTWKLQKENSGTYEFYLEVVCDGVIQRLPVTVTLDKSQCKVSLTSKIFRINSTETVALLSGGGIYDTGSQVTVTAPEKPGFTFVGWNTEYYDEDEDEYVYDLQSKNLSYTFTANSDVTLIALYESTANRLLTVEGSANNFQVNGFLQNEAIYQKQTKVGSQITVTYTGSNEFCYWKNDSGKIVSRDAAYSFTFVDTTSLTAVTLGADSGSAESGYLAMVEFISAYGQVMQAETWSSTANADDLKLPDAPSMFGRIFRYWSLDGTTEATVEMILAAINGTETHLVLEPVYETTETTYSITVKYPDDSEIADVLYENIKAGNSLVVTPQNITGKTFAYWAADADGSTILSYSKDYLIRATNNITLYAIYSDTEVEAKPVISMTNVYKTSLGEQKKVSFEVTRSVPDTYEVLETGILAVTNGAFTEFYSMTMNSTDVRKVAANSTDNDGIYTININVTNDPDRKLAVRGYMVLKDLSTGNIIARYSEIAITSYNSIP